MEDDITSEAEELTARRSRHGSRKRVTLLVPPPESLQPFLKLDATLAGKFTANRINSRVADGSIC
jgi:hypothetical protein